MLYTDNTFLSFLHKCAVTSKRVARWVIELQQYDLKICHIAGSRNFLADVLSRNPAGLTKDELRDLRQPANHILHAIYFDIGPRVKHELKDPATHRVAEQSLASIIEGLGKYKATQSTSCQTEYCTVWIERYTNSGGLCGKVH
jgi:hypothetical protein